MDCLEAMKGMEDNVFDLAIVDPPYGMGNKFKGGKSGKMNFNEVVEKGWDNEIPPPEYFEELQRVSKNQIIWGGNYFGLPSTRGFVIWDKKQPFPNFSACEYAWMSFNVVSKIFVLTSTRTGDTNKIHPTQKPVKLYEWLLMNYAKEGDRILDTHLGSGSHALACWNLNFDLTAYELDPDYFEATAKRIEKHTRQIQMF